MPYVFPPPPPSSVAVAGSSQLYPIHRIYCVGQNYAAHAREMGTDPKRERPCFFTKPPDAVAPSPARVPYPPATRNLHHEIELVVALGESAVAVSAAQALDAIYGYAVGLDLTRRDLQSYARERRQPWDMAKGFDHSAPLSAIHPAAQIGHVRRGKIWLTVNRTERQAADIADLIWDVAEVVSELSGLFALKAGDLVFTGTPAGVGPVERGDELEGGVDGVDIIRVSIV
jgi:fumarylpyruvate hydrolase